MSPRRIAIAASTIASVLLGLAGLGIAQTVGVTGAVNPNASGTPPGTTVRALGMGSDVVFNERIATEATGQADILFVDRSALTVGPNSDLVIDEFVYSPESLRRFLDRTTLLARLDGAETNENYTLYLWRGP